MFYITYNGKNKQLSASLKKRSMIPLRKKGEKYQMKAKILNLLVFTFIIIFVLSAATNGVHAVGVTATITVGTTRKI